MADAKRHDHDVVGSTNDVARGLADAAAPSGTAVTARAQTAGRGRRGAGWETLPGEHVFLSVVHRPQVELTRVAGLTLDMAVTVAEALAALGCAPRVKWPNDVLVGGLKVAGILCELGGRTDAPAVIVGIGVDANAPADALPASLTGVATTLQAALGAPVDVAALTDALIDGVRAACGAYDRRGGPDVAAFVRWSDTLGRRVRANDGREGVARALAPDGALMVEFDDTEGGAEAVRAGAVTILSGDLVPMTDPALEVGPARAASLLLVIDVGNTNTVLGVYDGAELVEHWRVATSPQTTTDELGVLYLALFQARRIVPERVRHAVISCVVPPMVHPLRRACRRYFDVEPIFVTPTTDTGITVAYDNPLEVGADRIVNAVAAYHHFAQACIIVDFGTATTFDIVTEDGVYVGGVIAPGIGVSLDALIGRAAQLPKVEIIKPEHIVGTNTISAIQAGIVYGYVGLVDGIVERLIAEYDTPFRIVSTGGLAALVTEESRYIEVVEPFLTLDGLRIIFDRIHAKGLPPRPAESD